MLGLGGYVTVEVHSDRSVILQTPTLAFPGSRFRMSAAGSGVLGGSECRAGS